MGRFGRSIIFAGVASSLLGRNGFYYYSEKEVSEELERILSMSPQEYRASLPTDDRCRLLLHFYETAVLGPGRDPDEASVTKRELLDTCPKWCSKVVEKVDNTSPKVSSQEMGIREMVEQYFAQLPLDEKCRDVTKLYYEEDQNVLSRYKNPVEIARYKRWMSNCPERFVKIISEIDDYNSKLSSRGLQPRFRETDQ